MQQICPLKGEESQMITMMMMMMMMMIIIIIIKLNIGAKQEVFEEDVGKRGRGTMRAAFTP